MFQAEDTKAEDASQGQAKQPEHPDDPSVEDVGLTGSDLYVCGNRDCGFATELAPDFKAGPLIFVHLASWKCNMRCQRYWLIHGAAG